MHILFVDDEAQSRRLYGAMLPSFGHRCEAARNGVEALEALKKRSFDLVISDIAMPGMGGIQLMKEARRIFPHLHFIMITGHTFDYTYQGITQEGASDFITKPINTDELKYKIERVRREKESWLSLARTSDRLRSLNDQLELQNEIAEKVFKKIVQEYGHSACPNIKHLQSPMSFVGGDLILIAVGPSGSQYILLGDFTGHGLSAALGAIPVSGIFCSMAEKGFPVSDIATEINLKLKNVLPTGLFLCACLLELNYAKGAVHLWTGGLPDVLITNGGGGIKKRFPSLHVPLGINTPAQFDSSVEVFELTRGDCIYLYTDGVTEAVNSKGAMFGPERLERLFQDPADGGRFDAIVGSLAAFRGETPQNDDITLAEVRYDIERLCGNHWRIGGKPEKICGGWRLALELYPDDLRRGDVLQYLMENLPAAERGLLRHKQNLYLILSELFSNALDYGLLGLDPSKKKDPAGFEEYYASREKRLAVLESGWVKIGLGLLGQKADKRLVIRVEDSGPGFNHTKVFTALSENLTMGGRGIQLVRSVCKEMSFHGKGNAVEVVYEIS